MSVFELVNTQPNDDALLTGIWASTDDGASFSLEGELPPIYRAQLPDDLTEAANTLAQASATQQTLDRQVEQFDQRVQDEIAFILSDPVLEGASFDISAEFSEEETKSIQKKIAGFAAHIEQIIRYAIHVETEYRGRLIGRAQITHFGTMTTSLQAGISAEVLQLHHQTVELAVQAYATKLRRLTIIVAAFVQITTILAAPLTSIPKTWRLIHNIIQEFS